MNQPHAHPAQPDREATENQAEAEGGSPWTGHAGIDRRVLEMTRVVVAKIDRDPALVQVGLENIERWTRQKKGYLPRCHAEWKELIETHPWERLREILLEESNEGQRLRSSHPFTGILTRDERDAIYARHGIDMLRMRREYEERTGRPWPTTTEMVIEQFGTADRRHNTGLQQAPLPVGERDTRSPTYSGEPQRLVTDRLAAAMKICTWNVGGGNGWVERVIPWLRGNQPDMVGLQEAGRGDHESVVSAFRSEGYCCKLHMEPDGKGRGVGILSRHPLEVTQVGLPGQEDRGARLLTACTAGLSVTTVCVPSTSKKVSIERKLAWLDALSEHLRERKTEDVPAVLLGDFNITPKPIDSYHYWENSKERKNRPGFREDERSWICSLLNASWFDLVRDLNPDERIFSYWHSPDLYNDDKGLRIDLVLGNAAVVKRLQSAWIDRGHYADRGKTGKPDHAPVVVGLT